ncbi:unnamed protein product [Leptidea sinapis]|uniref:Transmembrane protein 199 n=1 Tax=Leptidea sinapis TaxID=189913 RepID=A0A5E4QDZ9_9NEOP|nr:unnamed protein product [Leptidea sinapis]
MDLQGSLIDTKLKIYPSEKLIIFIKSIPDSYNVPANIASFMGDKNVKIQSSNSEKQIQLTDADINKLHKIKTKITELHVNKDDIKSGNGIELKENDRKNEDTKSNSVAENSSKSDPIDDKNIKTNVDRSFLTTSDLTWLYTYIKTEREKDSSVPYLHELLEKSEVKLPENEVIKRNPELESRCVKLRAQQEAREYRKMTKGVDNVRMRFPEDSISYQLKQVNRHLIAIGQFLLSIFAGFLFGFRGVEWMVGNLDFGFRLLLGVMCALVIALAEIYFLAKKLNEELSIPETCQLGGPPKFINANEPKYTNTKQNLQKQHQD